MTNQKATPIRVEDPAVEAELREKMKKRFIEQLRYMDSILPAIRAEGEAALKRLMPVAQGDTGQCGVVARFLLGLYNGPRFPFDLTDLRRLDRDLMEDCLLVLRMDSSPEKEVHKYFEDGGQLFEQLAQDWKKADVD